MVPVTLPPDTRYSNADLLPATSPEFRWRRRDFAAVWVCVSWSLASLVLAGMPGRESFTWPQILLICLVAQFVVLLPSLLVEHAGDRYGLPFAVFARSAFGVRGAALPALLRFASACVWFAFQADLGVYAITLLAGPIGIGTDTGSGFDALGLPYLAFLALQLWIITRGPRGLRRFADRAAPVLMAGLAVTFLWAAVNGDGPMLPEPERAVGWGADFWLAAAPAFARTTALFAALGLCVPDLMHLGSGSRREGGGEGGDPGGARTAVGVVLPFLLTGMFLFTMALASRTSYDPRGDGFLTTHALEEMPGGTVLAAVILVSATLCSNLAMNLVPAAYDLSSTAPSRIGFRLGAVLAALAGTGMLWWARSSGSEYEVSAWANLTEGFFGTVAGILVVEYWIVRRTRLLPDELYRAGGAYWYAGGWNWRAAVALLVGGVLAVGGSPAPTDQGGSGEPLVPFLAPLDDFGWVVGIVVSGGLYAALTLRARAAAGASPTGSDAA